jgi:aldose 1-epimerase
VRVRGRDFLGNQIAGGEGWEGWEMRVSCQLVVIGDSASGARAEINPRLGFNCTAFQVPIEGRTFDAIWTPEGFGVEEWKLYKGGIPILFPFAGRIRDARFEFEGAGYRLPAEDGQGNALHGLVFDRQWEVIEHSASRVIGRCHVSNGQGDLRQIWPADFELTVAYEVRGNELILSYQVRNTDGSSRLPWSFGVHPYFAVPFPGGRIESCVVTVPASSYWELDSRLLPTGRLLPISGDRDLRWGRALSQMKMDDVLGDLAAVDGVSTASIRDTRTGDRISLRFPESFGCCVVFTPPHRQAVCIEPYTCVPDAFAQPLAGRETAGLSVLKPWEWVSGWVRIGVATGGG